MCTDATNNLSQVSSCSLRYMNCNSFVVLAGALPSDKGIDHNVTRLNLVPRNENDPTYSVYTCNPNEAEVSRCFFAVHLTRKGFSQNIDIRTNHAANQNGKCSESLSPLDLSALVPSPFDDPQEQSVFSHGGCQKYS